MRVKSKSKKNMIVILGCMFVLLLLLGNYYFFTHNKSYKNEAIERGDGIYINGVRYWQTSEPESYTITNVVICTTDSGIKLYELEEYSDYEYIAGYSVWDGCIYRRDETDKLK